MVCPRDATMDVRILCDLREVEASAWDALVGDDDPFVEHAFLSVLEESGTVGPGTAWVPQHVTVWDGHRLVGAMPAYVKVDSWGEFIFDFAWADAARQIGIEYYPKIVSMIPVTPATGRRILVAEGVAVDEVVRVLSDGVFKLADKHGCSSVHILFLREEEAALLARDPRLELRYSTQFHWTNSGYRSFDDYLGAFRSALRKQVRKERREVLGQGLEIRTMQGAELTKGDWSTLRRLYFDTCERKGSTPYLTASFFDLAAERFGHRALACIAYRAGEAVAGSLNFQKGRVLYGRYWGSVADAEFLHFELCYYRLIEHAIASGMQRFEAGAQGIHKLRRGLMPVRIHSVHWVRHPILSGAVVDFLRRERGSVDRQICELAKHGPFRRAPG